MARKTRSDITRSPSDIIDATKYRGGCRTNSEIARRLGMIRQTFSHKRKYPYTFTGGEIASMADLFIWTDEETGSFIRGCKD